MPYTCYRKASWSSVMYLKISFIAPSLHTYAKKHTKTEIKSKDL
uniref:Uncharacterized protein n=1 Tax=Anguilla anguilla TaxID=7936 RepID=A0A0E9PG17_ANGAN